MFVESKEETFRNIKDKMTDKSNKDIIMEKWGLEMNTWGGHI